MITIYYYHISKNAHAALLQEQLPKFPVEFQKKILRFRRWEDAQLSLSGRLLLQYALQKHANLATVDWNSMSQTAFGKPYIANSNVHFNISHSGSIVACAITKDVEIGLDMEQIRPIDMLHFKSQMTENEWQYVNSAENQLQAFYEYWTKKEAVLKADGRGMSIPLVSFEIINNTATINSNTYYTKKIHLAETYMCHIASAQALNADAITIKRIPVLVG
ncbi:4'-phosphopantetheinyl transferase sfp [Kordia sp. SMS9]|uniref:4'-phosphopantetheinyl transferase family protein n=1 Tax=Kordia sp. SMS9 TaxID=2282170 RepID=UPI000E0CF1F0|nr:4'-phosphopantetheinyl transferase superfamily protein [Kordia sp. SMS9]AXG70742.1 4'-phosphopantetheinyl transferase sfp [Kordia sp. SMS9]